MNRDSRVVEIELEKLVPNRFQPRKTFNEDVSELAESIRAHGVLQPITVRPLGEKFEIVMGERRYRACEKLGLHKIPAMIVEMSDHEAMEVALIENLQRQDLNPIEEALSYKRILEAGYITQEQLDQRVGKPQSTIANKLRLLSLERGVQEALLKNQISERHARALLRVEDGAQQTKMLDKIIAEKLTVKKTEDEISKLLNENYASEASKEPSNSVEIIDLDDNPFDESDEQPVTEYNDYYDVNQQESRDSYLNYLDEVADVDVTRTSKLKPTVPNNGIIDDFENPDELVVVGTNHGYENAENGILNADGSIEKQVSTNNPVVPESEPEETIEDVELTNIEPDKIEVASQEEPAPAEKHVASNFDEVKAILDKCQSELNSIGYNVRLEKYDFEKLFQIVLKIDKK